MRQRLVLRFLHLLVSLLMSGGMLYLSIFGVGPVPPLGPTLNIGTGVWASAPDANPVQKTTFHFSQLDQPVTVIFEANGTPHIQAATDHDLFWTIGYLHARFRLTQMDKIRRMGQGQLAEILGSAALDSDRMMNVLGTARNAQAVWLSLPPNSPTRAVLLAYAQGVNLINNRAGTRLILIRKRPLPRSPHLR